MGFLIVSRKRFTKAQALRTILLAASMTVLAVPSGSAADPFVDRVVETVVGANQNPDFSDPDLVLGPPEAWGDEAIGGSLHVYNLGSGGSITVEFTDEVVYDGEGYDFSVFENPFYIGGSFDQVFLETARVAVSSDNIAYVTFPVNYLPQDPPLEFDARPDHYVGFAGVRPVFTNSSNGVNPLDPDVSGGDHFDLADIAVLAASAGVDINNIRFIRITDIVAGSLDDDLPPDDPDPIPETSMAEQNGFDLDAIAVLNGRPASPPDSLPAGIEHSLWEVFY